MVWTRLGLIDPRALVDARLQLHWAAQIAAAPAVSLAEAVADDSHTALRYLPERAALVCQPIGAAGWQCGLDIAAGELLLLDAAGVARDSQPVVSRTLQDCMRWLEAAAGALRCSGERPPIARSVHEPPHHTVGDGGRFDGSSSGHFPELARWYAAAYDVLSEVCRSEPGATAIRTWPHHFDMATLISLGSGDPAEAARSVGVGLSPGDGSYAEPYFYVTPWPHPTTKSLPKLSAPGFWHQQEWVGAVLPSHLVVDSAPARRRAVVMQFLYGALRAARQLLDIPVSVPGA